MANPNVPAGRGGPAGGGYAQLAPAPDALGTNEVLMAQATENLRLLHIVEQIAQAAGIVVPAGLQANVDA